MRAKFLRFVAAHEGLAFRDGELRLEMRAHEPQLIVGIHLHGHVEKAAPDFLRLSVQVEWNVRRGVPRDDGEAADEREVTVRVRGLDVFGVGVAEAGVGEAFLEILEAIRRSHFAHAEDVRIDVLDDLDERGDFGFGLGVRCIFVFRALRFLVHVIPHVVLADHDLLRCGEKRKTESKEEQQNEKWAGHVGEK